MSCVYPSHAMRSTSDFCRKTRSSHCCVVPARRCHRLDVGGRIHEVKPHHTRALPEPSTASWGGENVVTARRQISSDMPCIKDTEVDGETNGDTRLRTSNRGRSVAGYAPDAGSKQGV